MLPRTLNLKVWFIYWPRQHYTLKTGEGTNCTWWDFEKAIDDFCKWLLNMSYVVSSVTTLHIVCHYCTTLCYYCAWQRLFMVLSVAWRPVFNALHSLPWLLCTLVKGHEYALMQYFGERKGKKKHHCDFMWDDFMQARLCQRSLHPQIKINLIFNCSGLLCGSVHLILWQECVTTCEILRDSGGFNYKCTWNRNSAAHLVRTWLTPKYWPNIVLQENNCK